MQILEATIEQFDELMLFYERMNEVINRTTGLYNPDNAIFPSGEMVQQAIADHAQFVAIEDARIVSACIMSHECDDMYRTAHWNIDAGEQEYVVLHALRVLPEYSGQGVAPQMLEYLLQEAKRRGQKAVRLDVLDGYEKPQRIYRSFGFQYIETVEIFYEDIGHAMKFKLYEKVL